MNLTRSLLNKCEVYNFYTQKWTEIAPMNKTRCTCSAFIYNRFIYVIGGYTGEFQRSKKVFAVNGRSSVTTLS